MLIRSSSEIRDGFYLMTLGSSCHYLTGERAFTLFDAGYSVQLPLLLERIKQFNVQPEAITKVLATHLHPDRIGAVPYLRQVFPKFEFGIFAKSEPKIKDPAFTRTLYDSDRKLLSELNLDSKPVEIPFDEFHRLIQPDLLLHDGDSIPISESETARLVPFGGHTADSVGYLFHASQLVIVDESCGYFNLNGLHAPGADADLSQAAFSISKLSGLDLKGLCLPAGGVITGSLIQKFLGAVTRNSDDMITESKSALSDGVSLEEVKRSVFESFYLPGMVDPVSTINRQTTFDSLWPQIERKISQQS